MVTPGVEPRQAVRQVCAALQAAGCPDAAFDARVLVRLATGADPLLSFAPLTGAQAERLSELTARRCARTPLQYLCGQWEFLDLTLRVGPGVLCPRADTEVVVQAAAEALAGIAAPAVLDLCAGTGCIGIGIRRLCPDARVTAVEKSEAAFVWLEENAAHALDGRIAAPPPYVVPVLGDLFEYHKTQPDAAFDLIVSNPPYLTAAEMEELQPEVRQEPAMALEAGADGLDFYRALAEHYLRLVRPGGTLALEIGWQQRQAVTDLLEGSGWTDLRCLRDCGGNDRCVLARRPR